MGCNKRNGPRTTTVDGRKLEKLKFNGVVSNVEGGIGVMDGDVMMIEDDQLMTVVDGENVAKKIVKWVRKCHCRVCANVWMLVDGCVEVMGVVGYSWDSWVGALRHWGSRP